MFIAKIYCNRIIYRNNASLKKNTNEIFLELLQFIITAVGPIHKKRPYKNKDSPWQRVSISAKNPGYGCSSQ